MAGKELFDRAVEQLVPYDARRMQRYEPPMQAPVYLDAMPAAAADENASLAAYWQVIWRRRWTVVTTVAVLTTVAVIAAFKMKPVYKAIARVEVNAETPQMQTLEGMYQQMPTNQDFLRTQIQVLQTDNLAWRTVEQLQLGRNEAFLGQPTGEAGWKSDKERKMDLIRRFKSALSADLVPGSRVIEVGFESTDASLASAAANTLVNNYVDFNFRQQYDATRGVSDRMKQQLDELKAKVETSQQALVDYERKNSIFNVSEKQNVVEQRLAELSTDYTAAQADRMQKEALHAQVRSNPTDARALAQDDLLQKLAEKLGDLKNQHAEALAQYGPVFPKAVRLQKQVAQAETNLKAERSRLLDRIQSEYQAARKREALLAGAVAQQKRQESKLNQLLVQHNLLKGDFEANQKLYQRLMQQLKDATVAAGLRSTNIHIVDPALAPTLPVRPKKVLYIAIGLLLGAVFGTMLAFVQEAFDNSVKAPEDLEMLIATPTLAVIPGKRSIRPPRQFVLADRANGHRDGVVALTVAHEPSSPLAEAYRALRTATLLSTTPHPPKSILITSANLGEGKTTTALNLAIALAQRGGPVVMIGADMRRSNTVLEGIDTSRGLSTLLSGNDVLESVMQDYAEVPGLSIIPAGPVPPQPSELLSSEAMADLMRELGTKFKHIILDSPPIMAVTDATVLSTMVDGVILVVESGVTPKKMIARTRKVLENAGARVLGVVLNKFDAHSDGYGHYYSSYYYRSHEKTDA